MIFENLVSGEFYGHLNSEVGPVGQRHSGSTAMAATTATVIVVATVVVAVVVVAIHQQLWKCQNLQFL